MLCFRPWWGAVSFCLWLRAGNTFAISLHMRSLSIAAGPNVHWRGVPSTGAGTGLGTGGCRLENSRDMGRGWPSQKHRRWAWACMSRKSMSSISAVWVVNSCWCSPGPLLCSERGTITSRYITSQSITPSHCMLRSGGVSAGSWQGSGSGPRDRQLRVQVAARVRVRVRGG